MVLAIAVVVGAITLPSYAGSDGGAGGDEARRGNLQKRSEARTKRTLEARPHVHAPGTAPHNHNDPRTKNALSRSDETLPFTVS